MNGEHRWRSNSSSFGLFRDDGDEIRRNAAEKSRRFRLSFAVVAVALLIVTGVCVALQVTKSTREGVAKEKRFAAETKASRIDVDIVPEGENHPNHRYDQEEQPKDTVVEMMMKNMYWPAEEDATPRNNIRDIIKRIETREKLKRASDRRNPRGMGKPILFKGVYTKNAKTDGVTADDSDREYFKEINEVLTDEEKSSTEVRSIHALRGKPFQLKNHDESDAVRKSKKPITVMLDIYPVTKPAGEAEETGKKKEEKFVNPEPSPSGGRNIAYALVPTRGGRSRMIMKLNLYPKTGHRMSRRTFGWFKKPESHVCQLVGRKREWKPVTAEWKDEHGDWIKANYVTLKYWDRKFEK